MHDHLNNKMQLTQYGNLTGRTVAGRNMDGENDIRKLTVNALVLYALEPAEDDQQRVVHVMWPGFLGMSSGFNAAGRD